MLETVKSPYLLGSYAPVDKEVEGSCELIAGEVPRDLFGVLVRNGPNPRFEPKGRYHWFDGDGMLHAFHIENGTVSYRNRWVRTRGLEKEEAAGTALWGGIMDSIKGNPGPPYKDTANTDVVFHRGAVYPFWYLCGSAYRVDPKTLETTGRDDFGGTYKGVMSAHSKVDERTGDLLFFDYGPIAPYMHFGIIDAEGKMTKRVPVELPGPRLPHDLALTDDYGIVMDLPIVFDTTAMMQGRWKTSFDRNLPARFALVPRKGDGAVRWFEAEPCYMYHSVNAWQEGDEVVLVGCRVAEPFQEPRPEEGPYAVMMATLRISAALHEWRFDLKTGKTKERALDDRNAEFPTFDRRTIGRKTRFSYNVLIGAEPTVYFDGVAKYDLSTGKSDALVFGPGRRGSESPFAPRVGSTEEDDGYVLSIVHDEREDRSELWIIDAKDVARGPVARLRVPQRVPLGFHALFVPGEKLAEKVA